MMLPWKKKDYVRVDGSVKHLSAELTDFVSWLKSQPHEDLARSIVYRALTDVIKKVWPDAKVELYGSSATGMALPMSDVDVSVVSGFSGESPWFILSEALNEWHVVDLQVISTSRVPVVKFLDPIFGLSIDVTFGVAAGTTVALVDSWEREMDRLKPLVLIVKYLLAQRGLNSPYAGGLGSFSVVVMVRHFLMTLKIAAKQRHVAYGARRPLTPSSPLAPLLLGFLRYFGRFDYYRSAVLADGTTMAKSETGLVDPKQPYNMVLLNPLERTHVNCASSTFRMPEISAMFSVVEKQLREAVSMDLQHPEGPVSVLSVVIFPDTSVVERRERLATLVVSHARKRGPGGKPSKKLSKLDVENDAASNQQNV